jgi:hypothetical protein
MESSSVRAKFSPVFIVHTYFSLSNLVTRRKTKQNATKACSKSHEHSQSLSVPGMGLIEQLEYLGLRLSYRPDQMNGTKMHRLGRSPARPFLHVSVSRTPRFASHLDTSDARGDRTQGHDSPLMTHTIHWPAHMHSRSVVSKDFSCSIIVL